VSLPAGQERILQRIEKALQVDDAGLESLFAVFTRLAEHDAMPAAEQVAPWLQRQLQRPAAVIVIAVTAWLGILVLTVLPRGGQACGAAPVGSRRGQLPGQPAAGPAPHCKQALRAPRDPRAASR
jgi:hypothetical protein